MSSVTSRPAPATPLPGVVALAGAGDPVILHDGPIEAAGTEPGVGFGSTHGQVVLHLDNGLDLRWRANPDVHTGLGEATVSFEHPSFGPVDVPASVNHSTGSGSFIDAQLGDHTAMAARVRIHWLNIPSISPSELLVEQGRIWTGRWTCTGGGWAMKLDERPNLAECIDLARGSRKSIMTHIGELRRDDGAPFSAGDAHTALSDLQFTLSFALGRWVAPVIVAGVDSTDAVVWERWSAWRCDPFHALVYKWFDTHTGDDLAAFAAAFLSDCTDPDRREVARYVAHHAVAANNPETTLEARVMLAQAAIEYLAWATYVLEGGRRKSQHPKQAEAVVRELLVDAGIPNAVPTELAALLGLVPGEPNADGPRVLTWLRNRLVHPKDAGERQRAIPDRGCCSSGLAAVDLVPRALASPPARLSRDVPPPLPPGWVEPRQSACALGLADPARDPVKACAPADLGADGVRCRRSTPR